MKKIFLLFTLLGTMSVAYCQVTAKGLLEKEFFDILEQQGLLLTPAQKIMDKYKSDDYSWKNDNQREKAIKKDNDLRAYLQKFFAIPTFCNEQAIKAPLTFRNKSIGKLGSYTIVNNDLSVIEKIEPKLPIIPLGNQVSIPNPSTNGSNYRLNFTTSKLFQAAVNGNVDAGIKGIFESKFKSSFKLSNAQKMQISIGAGTFENQLAFLFRKVKNNQLQASEFYPIYYLWLAYKNGLVNTTDDIISSFDGMAFYSSNNIEREDERSFDGEANSSGKFPFLSYGLSGSTKWASTSASFSQSNIYNVYMFNFPRLEKVPAPEKILENWKTMAEAGSKIISSERKITADGPLVVSVRFGPIPDREIINNVAIDENYSLTNLTGPKFIKSVKLVTASEKTIKQDENNYYYIFEVEVERDENYLASGVQGPGKLICELPLRLYINNPLNGKYFDKVYDKIKITTDNNPSPYYIETDSYYMKPVKDGSGNFVYTTKLGFKTSNEMLIQTDKSPMVINDVFGLPTNADEKFKKCITSAKFKSLGNNNFELSFVLPSNSKYFDHDRRDYKLELSLTFVGDGVSYVRRLPANIGAPAEQLTAATSSGNIIIKDNDELIELLDPAAILRDGRKIADVKALFIKEEKLDVLAFIEEIKKQTNLSVGTDNKYTISSDYLDKSKLNKLNAR